MGKLDFKKLAKKAVKDAVKSKPAPAPKRGAPKQSVLWSKTFRQSGSFEGYKRIKLTTYREFGVDATLAHFARKNYNFDGSAIQLQNVHVVGMNSFKVVNVYADAMRIGCIYDTNSYYSAFSKDIDAVHLKVDGDVYLFVHYAE